MVKKLIYLFSIILSIGVMTSCSQDEISSVNQRELEVTSVENNDVTPDYETKSVDEKLYYFVVNSGDPQAYFETLSNEDKATVWKIKYQLFEEKTDLNEKQRDILYDLRLFVNGAQLTQDYDFTQFEEINQNVIAFFNPDQAMDLIYYIDNPSTATTYGCFWCDEIIDHGPCIKEELPQGGDYFYRKGEVQRYRFGIPWGKRDVKIPCSKLDWGLEK